MAPGDCASFVSSTIPSPSSSGPSSRWQPEMAAAPGSARAAGARGLRGPLDVTVRQRRGRRHKDAVLPDLLGGPAVGSESDSPRQEPGAGARLLIKATARIRNCEGRAPKRRVSCRSSPKDLHTPDECRKYVGRETTRVYQTRSGALHGGEIAQGQVVRLRPEKVEQWQSRRNVFASLTVVLK